MRTIEAINNIKQDISDPFSVDGFLDQEQLAHLINLFKQSNASPAKVYKNTGPITLDIKEHLTDPVIENILEKLKDLIGPFEITAAFFFWTNYPHIIHNDDTFELPDTVYKGITIPLELEGVSDQWPKLCFFDQFYFHGPAKFFNGSSNIPTFYNKQIYSYDQVYNLSADKIIDRDRYFTHLKPQWLKNLSLHSTLDWIPGNILVFDSVRLHCASDFRQLGIKSKLGISIFTKK